MEPGIYIKDGHRATRIIVRQADEEKVYGRSYYYVEGNVKVSNPLLAIDQFERFWFTDMHEWTFVGPLQH